VKNGVGLLLGILGWLVGGMSIFLGAFGVYRAATDPSTASDFKAGAIVGSILAAGLLLLIGIGLIALGRRLRRASSQTRDFDLPQPPPTT
jgi:Mn2+/Fe2+ NRAMP family transporter